MPRSKKISAAGGRGGIESLMAAVQAAVDQDSVMVSTVSRMYDSQRWIPYIDPFTGCPCITLQWLTGCKGVPVGRISQLRASYSAGKSSFLYYVYACAMRGRTEDDQKAWIAHVETEGAPNPPDYIMRFGLDPDSFLNVSANSFEDTFKTLDAFLCSVRGGFGGSVGDTGRMRKTTFTDPLDPDNRYPVIFGVDSFSALGEKALAQLDVLDTSKSSAMAALSRKLREWLRARQQRLARCNAALFVTSLETAKIQTGPMAYGGPQKSALGQEALAGSESVAFDVSNRSWKDSGVVFGSVQTLKTFKNKFAPRYRSIEMFRRDLGGYDIEETDVNFLLTHPDSPFAEGKVFNQKGGRALYRDSGGIHCPLLSESAYKSKGDFLHAIYDNEEVLMTMLEGLRVRGYGFDFEKNLQTPPPDSQIEEPPEGEEETE